MSNNKAAQDLDLVSIAGGLRKSLPVLLGAMLVIGVVTFAVSSMIAARYQAETQLTITAKPSPYARKNDPTASNVTPRLDPAAINTHVRALMAPDLLLAVAKSLKLSRRAEFNSAMGSVDTLDAIKRVIGIGGPRSGETTESRVLAAMQRNLTVSAARESRFLTIRFRSTSPQVAANVANGIAEAYRKSLREIPVRETNEAVAALLPKIKQLNREVFEAEAIAKRFRAETDQLTGGKASLTLQQQRLTALSADLVRAEAERSKSEARLRAARELASRGVADTLPEVQKSRIIQDLIAQRVRVERQVNEARAVLLPAHPRMRQLNADLSGINRSLRNSIRTIVNSIAKEVRLSQLRTEQLRLEIAELRKKAVAKSGDEAKLRSLETIAKSKRNELERLQKQLEDNRTVVDTNRVPVESTIVSFARPEKNAVFPKKGSYSLLAMAATLMLGASLVIARGLMSTGDAPRHNRRASDDAARRRSEPRPEHPPQVAGNPVLTGPLLRNAAAQRSLPVQQGSAREPAARSADASRSGAGPSAIAGYAQRFISQEGGGGFRVLLAGEHQSIDPSDEAIELVAEMSEAGARILLVDWSSTGDPLLSDIDISGSASLADLIEGRAQFEDVLLPLPDGNVHYAYATNTPKTAQLYDEEGLNLVLDAFDEAYDYVVVFGRHDDARALFETIEGRFDAGMTVADRRPSSGMPGPDDFLGFEVADIDIVHHVRVSGRGQPAARRQKPVSAAQIIGR